MSTSPSPITLTIAARYLTHASTRVCEPGGVDQEVCRQVAAWLTAKATPPKPRRRKQPKEWHATSPELQGALNHLLRR